MAVLLSMEDFANCPRAAVGAQDGTPCPDQAPDDQGGVGLHSVAELAVVADQELRMGFAVYLDLQPTARPRPVSVVRLTEHVCAIAAWILREPWKTRMGRHV